MESLSGLRSFKWILGLAYIVVALAVFIVGRVSLVETALLFGIGVLLL